MRFSPPRPFAAQRQLFQTFLSKAKFYTTTQKARMRKRIINITTFQWRRRPHQHFLFGTPIPPTDLRIPSRPPSFYSRVRSAVCSGASLTKPIQNQKNRNKKTNGQRSIRTAVASAQSLSTFFSSCTRVDSVRGAAYSHYSIALPGSSFRVLCIAFALLILRGLFLRSLAQVCVMLARPASTVRTLRE